MSDKKQALPTNARDFTDPEGVGRQQNIFEERAAVVTDAEYDNVSNTAPASSAPIAHTRGGTIDETSQGKRVTAVEGDDDKIALDVAMQDSQGNHIDEENPLAVYMAESPAIEVEDFDHAVDTVKNASTNHDYTVTAPNQLKNLIVRGSSSAAAKFELQIETAVAAGTFDTVDVAFNSVANPNIELGFTQKVDTGIIVRVVKSNYDNKDSDIYTRIFGLEI